MTSFQLLVQVIACILSNPLSKKKIPLRLDRDSTHFDEKKDDDHDPVEGLQYRMVNEHSTWGTNAPSPTVGHIDDDPCRNDYGDPSDYVCYCGLGGEGGRNRQRKSMDPLLSWVLCRKCLEPMHGLCAGFADMRELLSSTTPLKADEECTSASGNNRHKRGTQRSKKRQGLGVRLCHENRCPSCITAMHFGQDQLIESRATLIVTPPSILSQWEREIRRHTLIKKCDIPSTTSTSTSDGASPSITTQSLKVKVYAGVKEICNLSPAQAKEGMHRRLVNSHHLADADGE